MYKFLATLVTIGLLSGTPGCGNSGSSPNGQAVSQTGGANEQAISQIAQEFLEAIRTGNSAIATARLTPLAQHRMREADMDFDLLANEAARFEMGEIEVYASNEASVETVWMEPDAAGNIQKEQWTLALQHVEGDWRILGILADAGPNQPPVVMDFENPGQAAAPANTAGTSQPGQNVPQQATRPAVQDPFRQ